MRLDHLVVHVDNDEKILANLKSRIEPLGFSFEPKWRKGTKGFKAANIWIGRQYFEIIRLLRPDGGGWTPHWVEQYDAGTRGLYCLFLAMDDIDAVATSLKKNGVSVTGPERIAFKAFFGIAISNLVALAIMATAAATLHASKIKEIESAAQAAGVNADLKLTHFNDNRRSKIDPPWAPFGIKLMPFSWPSDRLCAYL